MNFEELKSEWNKGPENEVNIPDNLERLGKSKLPVDQVKKMMRKELYLQIGGIVFIGLLPLIQILPEYPYTLITDYKFFYMIYAFTLIISVLFIYKFYKFYIYINHNNVNTKDGLYEIYYELKLNLEAYKTWSYSITPMLIIMIVQIWQVTSKAINSESKLFENIYVIGLISVLCAIYMYSATNWWINRHYGQHLNRLKSILFDLNEDEAEYENNIKLENGNSAGFFQITKISKNNWYKIAIIIGILFSMGFFVGRWLAKSGY